MNKQLNVGSIIGAVVTPIGQPIEGAVLVITGDSPTHEDIAAITNNKGEYKFENLLTGNYNLLVNAEGNKQYTRSACVEDGKSVKLDFILDD